MSPVAPPETSPDPVRPSAGGAAPRRWRRLAVTLVVAGLVLGSAVLLTARPWSGAAPSDRSEDTLTRLQHGAISTQAGPTDIGFADVMLSYVQQADEIVLLARGRSLPAPEAAQVADLADSLHRLRSTQAELLTRMLAAWQMLSVHQTHTHQVGTMLTAEELVSLQQVPDSRFTVAWASVLLEHWHGMVPLAQDEARNGTNGQARDLANELVTGFSDYIEDLAALARG